MKTKINRRLMLIMALTFFFNAAFAQEDSGLQNYIRPVTNITLTLGAFIGAIGGIRLYFKYQEGEEDISGEFWKWAGACIFLVLSSIVVKLFTGF